MGEQKHCFLVEANDNYERGCFRVVGVYTTRELAEQAKAEIDRRYFVFIKEWELDTKPNYYNYG
jgi:hypothetical protein